MGLNIRGKATILAVGTELTTGQVTNRNAVWISEQLDPLGVEVVLHATVPDDREGIRNALDHCASLSQFIFVTGGLGPTTDDFTREVIADWLNKPLEFKEDIWDHVTKRLTDLGVPIAESNRRQCFFPLGSQVLPNPEGTAAGFTWVHSKGEQQLWAFPGPPHEVSAVWGQGIAETIQKQLPEIQPHHLFTWQCMGKSEAELGEITEATLQGSPLKTGYRAHRPFVEIKIWCPSNQIKQNQHWIEKLTKTLAPWTITQQGEDLAIHLLHQIKKYDSVQFLDAATGGLLAARLGKLFREPRFDDLANTVTLMTEWSKKSVSKDLNSEQWITETLQKAAPDSQTLSLMLSGFTADGTGMIALRNGNQLLHRHLSTPYQNPKLRDRMQYFLVEMALKQWNEWLMTGTEHP